MDEEVGPSDLDLLNLTDYEALCFGTRTVFLEISIDLSAAKVGVGNAQSAPWDSSAKQPLGLSKKTTAGTSALNPVRKHVIGTRVHQWSPSIWSVARGVCELCGLCLASNACARYRRVNTSVPPDKEEIVAVVPITPKERDETFFVEYCMNFMVL